MNEITNKDLQDLKKQLDKWDLDFHKKCKDKIAEIDNNNIVRISSGNHICYEMLFEDYQELLNWKK